MISKPASRSCLVNVVPFAGIRLQEASYQLAALKADVGRNVVVTLQNQFFEGRYRLCTEGHGAGHNEEEQHSQCPVVDVRSQIAFIAKQFWGCVWRRSAKRRKKLVLRGYSRTETKVTHFDGAVIREEYVLCFDISVDQVVLVLERK